jgi:peptidoglycan/LPS O-acetylase OafA/YrhL
MVLVAICRCLYFYVSKNAVAYEAIYFNTFFRADSFAGGIILFLLLEKNNPPLKADKIMNYLMGTIVLLMLIPILNYRSPDKHSAFFSTIGYTFVALIYTYLLFITLLKKNKIINILTTSAFLRYTGKISYGIYIFHYPLFQFGFIFCNRIFKLFHFASTPEMLSLTNALICIPLTFLISHLSFKYFESRFLKMKVSMNQEG